MGIFSGVNVHTVVELTNSNRKTSLRHVRRIQCTLMKTPQKILGGKK